MTGRDAVAAVILAAGKGTRMASSEAKVLVPLAGRPLIDHVLDTVLPLELDRVVVVVGHQHQTVREALAGRGVEFVLQEPQNGTGHALQCAAPSLEGFQGTAVVLAGDAPLLRGTTLSGLLEHHRQTDAAVTVLTAVVPDPDNYGRVLRDAEGRVTAIVEDRDCPPEQKRVREINSSIYAFDYPFLAGALPRLSADNSQKELYLTDTVGMAVAEGKRVEAYAAGDYREVLGVNTVAQLEEAARVLLEWNRG
jgi:bifunctional UDP-N-acetylglucosamine pyrophosphorylase/glucosamine-1-phosphate N-acetyltransferase